MNTIQYILPCAAMTKNFVVCLFSPHTAISPVNRPRPCCLIANFIPSFKILQLNVRSELYRIICNLVIYLYLHSSLLRRLLSIFYYGISYKTHKSCRNVIRILPLLRTAIIFTQYSWTALGILMQFKSSITSYRSRWIVKPFLPCNCSYHVLWCTEGRQSRPVLLKRNFH
jgi:hypothetical protein